MPKGSAGKKDWVDFMASYYYRYVRTMKSGCRVFRKRTERGRKQMMRLWVEKYPYLFTKEAREEICGRPND